MVLHVNNDGSSSINKPRNTIDEAATTAKDATPTPTSKAGIQKTGPPRSGDASESPAEYTKRSLDLFNRDSKLNRSEVPTVTRQDLLEVGPQLGEGGFSIVSAVELEEDNIHSDEEGDRPSSWAMKSLKPDIVHGPMGTFKIAAADLWKEAEFLSAFHHPGIVALRAKHFSIDALDENFIILERIQITLDEQMQLWREADQKARNSPEVRLKLLKERLAVCLELCETFKYLHSQNVIFRDLKSANIGFDHKGKVKLFDFGLAKELKEGAKSSGGKYKLSGNTGSLAYMAPEVAKGWQYDKTVDVYSFGILLWEIAALQPAFAGKETREQMHEIWSGDQRPPMASWWPVELQWLMKKCWAYFANSRPDFTVIGETLEEILHDENKEEEDARAIKSFRFGSRRSQKISRGSGSSNGARPATLRPRDLPEEKSKKKFFGLF